MKEYRRLKFRVEEQMTKKGKSRWKETAGSSQIDWHETGRERKKVFGVKAYFSLQHRPLIGAGAYAAEIQCICLFDSPPSRVAPALSCLYAVHKPGRVPATAVVVDTVGMQ